GRLVSPLKMSETLYDGFEKMGKKQNKEQVPPPQAEPENKKPSSSKPSKKTPPSNTVAPTTHRTLEEAFKALDVADLKQQLARSQTLFPENPSVWVKDLAGYLNLNLTAPEAEPTLSSYAHDYPYCLTGKELKGVIKGLIGRCSDILPDFFDHCVYTMLRELDRQSESLHGYRVCIQAILQDKPRIATQNLPEYLELLRSVQNRPVKCLTIMWALGQAGFYDLSQGLRVWLGIMLPVLGVKSLSSYAIAYLERLLLLHANLTKGFGIMGPKEFFPLLDFAFMPKNALSSSLQEQLRRLYPRLKALAFGAKPETTLHTYLPSFLSRATPHCPDDMKRELLSSMTECLCVDVQSLGTPALTFDIYNKTLLPQDGSVINLVYGMLCHLLFDIFLFSFNVQLRKNLEETIQSFRVTNEEMKDTIETQELQECNNLCQNLQVKMRGRGFPWSKLLMVLLVFAAGFIAHDIRSQGSFADSTTARHLRNSGVTAVSQQAWGKIAVYSKQGFGWLETNTPHYYSECVRVLGPLMEQGLEKAKTAAIFISENTLEWVRLSPHVNTNTPDSVFQLLAYIRELLLLLHQNYILPALAYISELLQRAWTNLQDSCNGEVSVSCLQAHAVSFTNSTWQLLQHTTSAIKTWAQELLTRA
uniref:Transmembrane protein 214 n=1 Tax=Labrus bergylta TaxID=56723 RepID=A0A3Q3FV15_9LABR